MRFFQSLFFTAPFALILSACTITQPQTQNKTQTSTPQLTEEVVHKAFSSILENSFRGQLTTENNKFYFQACEDDQQYTIVTDTELATIYKKISNNTQQPVYIEFAGEINFTTNKRAKNPVALRVDRIHHMALAQSSLQCAKPLNTFRFKAKGEDPYWRINMHDNQLFFATKASNQSYLLGNANFEATQINHLKSSNAEGQQLALNIQPGHCYMSDDKEYWGYITEAETVYGHFSGCGEPGWLETSTTFAGYYLKAATNQSPAINLTLNENHSAEYVQGNKPYQIIKTGYWKSNTPDNVVVMLAQQGDQPIQEEIIFKQSGLSISSNAINISNIQTSFATPLTFKKMNLQAGLSEDETVQITRQFNPQNIAPKMQIDTEVQAALRQYFKIHRTDPKQTKFSSVRFDLNGDGQDEAIAFLDWCSSTGCEMIVFEAKDDNLVFSSRISRVYAPITVAKSQHFSWQSLASKKGQQWSQLEFDGLSYPLKTHKIASSEQLPEPTGVVLFSQGKPNKWFPIK